MSKRKALNDDDILKEMFVKMEHAWIQWDRAYQTFLNKDCEIPYLLQIIEIAHVCTESYFNKRQQLWEKENEMYERNRALGIINANP